MDPATGLYYFGARYYDPKTSVWLGVDPLAEKYPSTSPYMYCLGNPVVYFDPDGRKFEWGADKNSQATKQSVLNLVASSDIFASLYNYLDNISDKINVSTNDTKVQQAYQKASKGLAPNGRAGGYNSGADGNTIVFSEIYADQDAFVEEFFHSYQNKDI